MRRLSSIMAILMITAWSWAQKSPHGKGFEVSCAECHNPESWKVDFKTLTFDHGTTKFPLTGQHLAVGCRLCHQSLEFQKASKECVECHTDMHNQTVGTDCGRCHTPVSWVVNNITEMHQRSRFPLTGAHVTADCYDCHTNAASNLLLFGPLGIECFDCHQDDYASTTKPNHLTSGFSTSCSDCHNIYAYSWTGTGFNHSFFPLTGGHENVVCSECHKSPVYTDISAQCVSCHQDDYNGTLNPNHVALEFSTDCAQCHTLSPGWRPAEYREHDAKSFPIYSGKHAGEWNSCAQCHPNPSNYTQFSCTDCHEHNQNDMDDEHGEVQGYAYNSQACLDCHPNGDAEGAFNHSTSAFPLTGAHIDTECAKCHTNGYNNTPNTCAGCHMPQFNSSLNPNHVSLTMPTTCETCHTTQPDWKPATFPIHDNYYRIEGAHLKIATDCFTCHQGNYTSTPNTCFGCHQNQYNQTNNPNHTTAGFPTTCETCHSQSAWQPATFDHNSVYPLTGAHAAIATNCDQCHQGNYTNTPNTCVGCHQANYNQTSNPPHAAAQFPVSCDDCHSTTAWAPANWNHDNQYFPIYSGKHKNEWNACSDCHNNPSNYAIFTCTTACHPQSSTNSEHQGISGYSYNSTACLNCHPNGSGDKMMERFFKND